MIYYTSDLHLGHENIIKHCNRPFSSVVEMDRVLINNWNSVITNRDQVYIAGDIAFRGNKADIIAKIRRLNGKKFLVVGNHDGWLLNDEDFKNLFVTIDLRLTVSDNGRKVVIHHYPMVEWDGFFRGSYHVYGHIHNGSPQAAAIMKTIPNAFNAGVDLNDFMPQTLDTLINRKNMGIY